MEANKISSSENIMGVLPINRLLLKMALPVIFSMLVQSLYNVVDSIYVSRLGTDALTAISLTTPVASLLASISVGLSVGVNAVLSKKLGENNVKKANRAAGNGILIEWACFVLFMIFGLFFTRGFYAMQTSDVAIQQMATAYTSITCIFSFGIVNQVIMERLLISTGKTIGSMFSLLTGAITNTILDPILIFGLGPVPAMGIQGAAIATVIAQFAAASVAFGFNLKVNEEIKFSLKMLKADYEIIKEILFVGVPTALTQAIGPLMLFGMNQILLSFTTAAPAVYVIFIRLQSIFLMPVWGLKNTVVSIIAYNYGAGFKKRIVESIRTSVISVLVVTIIGTLIFALFPNFLLNIFSATGLIYDIGMVALRIVGLALPFMSITLICGSFFQALGHSNKTLIISIVQICILFLSAFTISKIGDVYSIWSSFLITELIVSAISLFVMRYVYSTTIGKISEYGNTPGVVID